MGLGFAVVRLLFASYSRLFKNKQASQYTLQHLPSSGHMIRTPAEIHHVPSNRIRQQAVRNGNCLELGCTLLVIGATVGMQFLGQNIELGLERSRIHLLVYTQNRVEVLGATRSAGLQFLV